MKMKPITAIKVTLSLVSLILVSTTLGCSNPVDNGHKETEHHDEDHHDEDHHDEDHGDEDHAEGVGVIISSGDQEIVRYENRQVDGSVLVGVNQKTPLLSVFFIGEDGKTFVPETDEGFTLAFDIKDTSVAEIEHNEEDAPWSFYVKGVIEGETFVAIKLNHSGHADFVSKEIPIFVQKTTDEDHGDEDHAETE